MKREEVVGIIAEDDVIIKARYNKEGLWTHLIIENPNNIWIAIELQAKDFVYQTTAVDSREKEMNPLKPWWGFQLSPTGKPKSLWKDISLKVRRYNSPR